MDLTSKEMKNLLFLFMLVYPATTPERVYSYWPKHKVLREYTRPGKEELIKMIKEIKAEIKELVL